MLVATMGSPIAFESRRRELQELGQSSSDDDVLRSFEELLFKRNASTGAVEPGLLSQYLMSAQIALRLKDILIVHGGLRRFNKGYMR